MVLSTRYPSSLSIYLDLKPLDTDAMSDFNTHFFSGVLPIVVKACLHCPLSSDRDCGSTKLALTFLSTGVHNETLLQAINAWLLGVEKRVTAHETDELL